jgi:hypothetical protein
VFEFQFEIAPRVVWAHDRVEKQERCEVWSGQWSWRAKALKSFGNLLVSLLVGLRYTQKANYMFKPTAELPLRLIQPCRRGGLTWR